MSKALSGSAHKDAVSACVEEHDSPLSLNGPTAA